MMPIGISRKFISSMGILKRIEEWEIDVGENVGGYIQDALKEAAGFLCGVRAKYPNSFFDRSFGRGIANSICDTVGKPNPTLPPPPFTGGQCEGLLYNVTYDVQITEASGRVSTQSGAFSARGALSKIFALSPDPDFSNLAVVRYIRTGQGAILENEVVGTYGPGTVQLVLQNIEVATADGSPDSCGNPPVTFDPDPPRDPNDFRTTIEICDRNELGEKVDCVDVEVVLPEKDAYDFPVCITVDGRRICLGLDGWSVEDAPTEEEEEKEEEEFTEEEKLVAVVVKVDLYPTRGTTYVQLEDPDAINFYAGYLSWKYQPGEEPIAIPGELHAVRRVINYFPAPEENAGYDIFSVNGAEISVREITEIVKVPVPKQEEPMN